MKRGKLRALVLDFDGVIIESNDAKTEGFRHVFSQFPEIAEEMVAYHLAHISDSRFSKFDHLLERLGRAGDAALRDELAAEFSRRTIESIGRVPFVPGAESFLRELAPRVPLYLASVTPEDDLATILERRNLRRWFRAVYGCPPWTKVEALRDVIQRESCSPAEVLLIGDSAGDQRAAVEAGVEFIARDSGLAFESPPITLVRNLDGLAERLGERL